MKNSTNKMYLGSSGLAFKGRRNIVSNLQVSGMFMHKVMETIAFLS